MGPLTIHDRCLWSKLQNLVYSAADVVQRAYGKMDCRNSNESGKVAQGTMGTSLLQLRVMMPDGSDCMFNGHVRRDKIEGG